MKSAIKLLTAFAAIFVGLLALHYRLLRLPYFWDEAGYYIPAALDFYRWGALTPATTLPEGHPPLVTVYLGLTWHVLGYSIGAARAAITLIAAGTLAALYVLARRLVNAEVAAWSTLLLALSPLFFAQTTLVHLDLAAALFTTLAVVLLLADQLWWFALAASLAVLSKETAVVLLPVVWVHAWRKGFGAVAQRDILARAVPLVVPLPALAAWTLYYHHMTGYWTGNRGYLSYNLYSTLSPARFLLSLLRRVYVLFVSGFNWLLTACAMLGMWWGRKYHKMDRARLLAGDRWPDFTFLTAGLTAVYLCLLSLVGGAVLPRYLLPVLPAFYLIAVTLVLRLPRLSARVILAVAAVCFVWAWFINPPYPFPFEDNLAYGDFIHLHERAAQYLQELPGQPRILTAWPATDELTRPFLGYLGRPLRIVPVQGFAAQDFAGVPPESFDLLYLYSRRWEPPGNWLDSFPGWLRLQERYFDYHEQISAQALAKRYHLQLVREFDERGQWVRVYSR